MYCYAALNLVRMLYVGRLHHGNETTELTHTSAARPSRLLGGYVIARISVVTLEEIGV